MKILIQLKNIFIDLSNRSILSDISLSLYSNRIVTLIGPNGAGKSTLVRVILGLIQPKTGSIMRIPNLNIGYVPQKLSFHTYFPISVYNFLKLLDHTENAIIQVLNKIHIYHLRYIQLNKLSGGEIQKVLLARALLNNPKLLILDEPIQGVDINGQIAFYKLIHQLKKELSCAIVIVSHDIYFVMAQTDEVICLNNHICCSGSPKTITKNLKFISMFGTESLYKLALYPHKHNHVHVF
ncbi:zinc ABC transporter ATP-binding protein ZnuC [Buchnera aphidicola (Takecallis taiwana)]|uniref:zinc ABC transporter ATP-binding protein ZnuC n=1 Tax=Buchnera aphidicola TaxID=9 RepID=UPI0031B6D377